MDLVPEILRLTTGMKFNPELTLQQEIKFSFPLVSPWLQLVTFLLFPLFFFAILKEKKKKKNGCGKDQCDSISYRLVLRKKYTYPIPVKKKGKGKPNIKNFRKLAST